MNFHACIGPVLGAALLMAGSVAEARTLCTRNGLSTECVVIKGERPNHHVITWTDPQSRRESWTFAHGGANNVWVTTPYAEAIRGMLDPEGNLFADRVISRSDVSEGDEIENRDSSRTKLFHKTFKRVRRCILFNSFTHKYNLHNTHTNMTGTSMQ